MYEVKISAPPAFKSVNRECICSALGRGCIPERRTVVIRATYDGAKYYIEVKFQMWHSFNDIFFLLKDLGYAHDMRLFSHSVTDLG